MLQKHQRSGSQHVDKQYIQANALLEDSFALAIKILDSGLRPDLLIGLWRGGTPIAIAVHEALRLAGVEPAHLPIKTSVYQGLDDRAEEVQITGLEQFSALTNPPRSVVLIDDVFDSGTTMAAVRTALSAHPTTAEATLHTATVWWKPARNRTQLTPDYWVHETDRWLVFPHELDGLSQQELAAKPGVNALLVYLASQPGSGAG